MLLGILGGFVGSLGIFLGFDFCPHSIILSLESGVPNGVRRKSVLQLAISLHPMGHMP